MRMLTFVLLGTFVLLTPFAQTKNSQRESTTDKNQSINLFEQQPITGPQKTSKEQLALNLLDHPWGRNEKLGERVSLSNGPWISTAINGSGNMVVVWDDGGYQDNEFQCYYRLRQTSGDWGPINKVQSFGECWYHDVALDLHGNIHLVWNVSHNIYYSSLPAGSSTWTTAVDITDQPDAWQHAPALATDSEGNVFVVWLDYRDSGGSSATDIYFAKKDVAGSWSTNERVTSKHMSCDDADIAIDSQGNPHVVWESSSKVYYTHRNDIEWEPEQIIADNDGSDWIPTIAIDEKDGITIVWIHHTYEQGYSVYSRFKPYGGSWEEQQHVYDAINSSVWRGDPAVASSGDGLAVAIWRDYRNSSDTNPSCIDLYSSFRLGNGLWSVNVKVNDYPCEVSFGNQTVVMDSVSNSYAAWFDSREFYRKPFFSSSNSTYLIPSWTLMYYLDGDESDIDESYVPIFNHLESVANNPNVNVVALWDRLGENNSSYYKIQYDTNLNQMYNYQEGINRWTEKNELNMGDPTTLADFIEWGISDYPAEHYALILDDHGSGLGGAMLDETDNFDIIEIPQIQTALDTALDPGHKIDVLIMNACLMGMIEDAYQFKDYINFYVASENLQWVFKSGYSYPISNINESTSPRQLVELFVNGYDKDPDKGNVDYTMSGADISQLDVLVSATNNLASLLNSNMESNANALTTVLDSVQRFDNELNYGIINTSDTYIDLYDFARLVNENFSNTDIRNAAQVVMEAVGSYIFINRHAPPGSNVDQSHGVSIFYPAMRSSFYRVENFDFAAGTDWGQLAGETPHYQQSTIDWGPMLVSYFDTTQPGGPDDPTPPEVRKKPTTNINYIPIIYK